MLSMIANPVTALPVGYPRSGLSRSDLVLWPTASDIAVQANVGFQVNCGSRWRVLERSKMTPNRHQRSKFAVLQKHASHSTMW
jgi:hypothetical protein